MAIGEMVGNGNGGEGKKGLFNDNANLLNMIS